MRFLRPSALPPLARHTFHYEIRSALLTGAFGGLLLPFLIIVGRKIGATDMQVALLVAAPYLANAFSLLWTEDPFRKGRVWYVVWPCVAGRGLLLAMFFVTTPLVYTAVVIVYMVITAIPFPSYASIMKTNYPDELRGRVMSYVRVSIATVWTAASAVAGWVLERGTENFRLLFPAAAVFGVLSALQFRHIKVRRGEQSPGGINHLMAPLRDPSFLKFIASYTLFELGVLVAMPIYPLVLVDEVNISNMAAGVYGSIFSVSWLLGFFFWGHFLDSLPARKSLAAVFLTSLFVPLIYLVSRDLLVLGIGQAVSGFLFAAVELANYIVIIRLSSGENVTRYTAANIALGGLRGAFAPFIGAALYSAYGAGTVFTLSLSLGLLGLVSAWKLLKIKGF